MIEHSKQCADWLSVGAVLGTLAGYLPIVAALVSTIWTLLRIYEMKTVQDWIKKRKKKRNEPRSVKRSE